jgi:hypothetical protein
MTTIDVYAGANMKAKSYVAALRRLELSTEDSAVLLGISRATAFRYACGKTPIPYAIGKLLEREVEACAARYFGPAQGWQGFRDGKPVGPMVETKARAYALALNM